MIDQNTIDRIIATAQIADVVGDFVTLKKRGVNLIGLCPFHDEKTPSFTVSPAKNICKCFGCGKGGSPVNFIMEHEHLAFHDALRFLAKKYNIEIVEKELSKKELAIRDDRESMHVLNNFAQQQFSDNLWTSQEGKNIGLSYFKERGFADDTIKKFGLGYSIDQYQHFGDKALQLSYRRKYLIETGLCSENKRGSLTDRFRGRVMFPIYSIAGKVVGFGGRVLKKDEKTAKYVNSPESTIYHKSRELYGLFHAKHSIVKLDRCFLVEGYTDVLSMHQSGIENVVASSGTALTPGQIKLIHRFTPNITLLYDGDAAGIKASIRGIDLLLEEGMNVKVVQLPEGEDPDSFAQKLNASDFITHIDRHQKDFIHFKTSLLLKEAANDPIKKAALISDIVKSISVIPDNIVRSIYIKECARKFDMSEALLNEELNKMRSGRRKLVKPQFKSRTNRIPTSSGSYAPSMRDIPPPEAEDDEEPYYVSLEEEQEQSHVRPYAYFQEQNLLRCIVMYGHEIIKIEQEDGSIEISVIDFIQSSMLEDEQTFEYPLHQQLFEECLEQNGNIKSHFLNHPNLAIQNYVFSLVEEKYERSAIHDRNKKSEKERDRLDWIVPKILLEYKGKILDQEIELMGKKIRIAQEERNDALLLKLLTKKQELITFRKDFICNFAAYFGGGKSVF